MLRHSSPLRAARADPPSKRVLRFRVANPGGAIGAESYTGGFVQFGRPGNSAAVSVRSVDENKESCCSQPCPSRSPKPPAAAEAVDSVVSQDARLRWRSAVTSENPNDRPARGLIRSKPLFRGRRDDDTARRGDPAVRNLAAGARLRWCQRQPGARPRGSGSPFRTHRGLRPVEPRLTGITGFSPCTEAPQGKRLLPEVVCTPPPPFGSRESEVLNRVRALVRRGTSRATRWLLSVLPAFFALSSLKTGERWQAPSIT